MRRHAPLFVVALLFTPGCVRADAAGEALLQKCVDAETKLRSLQASFSVREEAGAAARSLRGVMKLQRPNRALISIEGGQPADARTLASDGRRFIIYHSADNEFERQAADPSGGNVGRAASLEATVFFNPDVLNQLRAAGTGAKIAGVKTVGGTACRELRVAGLPPHTTLSFFVGPDNLLHGMSRSSDSQMGLQVTQSSLSDLKPNASFAPTLFAFALPKGAKPYQERETPAPGPTSGTDSSDSGLLPVGSAAPDFQLPQPDGGRLTFSAVYRAHRATLLCFWNNGFAPCREELPDLNKLLAEMKDRGLDMVAVDSGDSAAVIKKLWKDAGLTIKATMTGDKVADKYRVTAVPTNYLIGANGRVLARFEGFDETAIRAAIEKAGVR